MEIQSATYQGPVTGNKDCIPISNLTPAEVSAVVSGITVAVTVRTVPDKQRLFLHEVHLPVVEDRVSCLRRAWLTSGSAVLMAARTYLKVGARFYDLYIVLDINA